MTAIAMRDDWIVLKFGGTSVSRRHRWDIIGELMRERVREEQSRVLVVVSALSGVTNELQAIVDGRDDAAFVQPASSRWSARHVDFCAELGRAGERAGRRASPSLRALGGDPRRDSDDLGWAAEVLAQGELLSSTLGVAYLALAGHCRWSGSMRATGCRHAALPNQNEWSQRLSVSCHYQRRCRHRAPASPAPRAC